MTDARSFQSPTDAPEALGLNPWVQGLFVAPSKRVGGRPKRVVQGDMRSPQDLRAPEPGETGLSASEIQHAISIRVLAASSRVVDSDDEIDRWPVVRRLVPFGQWGIKAEGLRHAQPFDGLTA